MNLLQSIRKSKRYCLSLQFFTILFFKNVQNGNGRGRPRVYKTSEDGAKEYPLAASLRKITNKMVHSGVMIYGVSFLFAGVNTISSFYFTSISKAMESAIISSARGLVILLICIFTLPPLLGMTGVWLVAPITELFTLILSFTFIIKENRLLHAS